MWQVATSITSHISRDCRYFIHGDPVQHRNLIAREAAHFQMFLGNRFSAALRTVQHHQVGDGGSDEARTADREDLYRGARSHPWRPVMTDTLTSARRSWNMSRIKGRNTGPELRLRSLLHRAGFRFRLHAKQLPGRPDVVLPKYRTAIFVHGCFWHRHPGCRYATTPSTRWEFWQEKFDGNVSRDARDQAALEAAGWIALTVWECELKADAEGVLRRLADQLRGDG
jgi:DNA mismatch endonuclease, patch repair protein